MSQDEPNPAQGKSNPMSQHDPQQDHVGAAANTVVEEALGGAEADDVVQADLSAEQAPQASAEDLMQAATARIQELEATLADMRDRWVRSEAEMQNVRQRARREADDARQYAVQKFARDVVEGAENLRRGLASLPPAGPDEAPVLTKLRDGFESVERSFLGVLERNGVVGSDPTGAAFDANLHQAMAEQPSAEHPPGTVIQAWTLAWTLNGRLLKPAMVVVARAASTADAAASAPRAEAGAEAGEALDRTV